MRILSIHKSKGLEFPFVFLCDTARLFNKSDTRASVLVHPVLGLGPKCTDLEHGVEYPTIARQAIAAQLLTEMLSEEMRLLYVAMTRAKERLVITGTVRDIGKTVSTPDRHGHRAPRAGAAARCAEPAALAAAERAARPGRALSAPELRLSDDGHRGRQCGGGSRTHAAGAGPALLAQLERTLTFRYAHAQAIDLPSKVTATELKRLEPEDTPPEDAGAPLLKGRAAHAGLPPAGFFRRASAGSLRPSAARPRTARCNICALPTRARRRASPRRCRRSLLADSSRRARRRP